MDRFLPHIAAGAPPSLINIRPLGVIYIKERTIGGSEMNARHTITTLDCRRACIYEASQYVTQVYMLRGLELEYIRKLGLFRYLSNRMERDLGA
jgi:hypothetical protein